MTQAQFASLETNGFCVLPTILDSGELADLVADVQNALQSLESSGRRGVAYSLRDVFGASPKSLDFVRSRAARKIVEAVLGNECFAVRSLLFDKTPGANWKVPFHQDLTIAVKERIEAPGFGPWSTKAGVLHVQPPREILESMLTLRLHLDDCDASNGALRVLPGSHTGGKFSAGEIQACRETTSEVICDVSAGGVLLMRPLLLHASSPANSPVHRRVLHFDFAARELPHGLEWYCCV